VNEYPIVGYEMAESGIAAKMRGKSVSKIFIVTQDVLAIPVERKDTGSVPEVSLKVILKRVDKCENEPLFR